MRASERRAPPRAAGRGSGGRHDKGDKEEAAATHTLTPVVVVVLPHVQRSCAKQSAGSWAHERVNAFLRGGGGCAECQEAYPV